MNIEEFRDFCLSMKGVTEELPFGPDTLVYKVMGKMFALTGLDTEIFTVNLKCDPDRAIQLREEFHYITPGYHMNKKHWNTVNGDNASTTQLKELTEHSYQLVVSSLPKKVQVEFQNL
ncbi:MULTISPECIES: MmcQ/YjbR family DNA-binding protein [unclassified Arcicella]|uniref:MmcQ/YjbR family DNA-binding protein n=1 Tax=unclassified Arcicella TaxID=2644986 RepID=UPI00285C9E61|nr:MULTISPECIES: MmcQ/YjbR family DNA-binding protein [unclassified Arcicella]MDR6561822.1 putative DNA-binding protein (MmcQ/YjbR family) [Arcicella sp. BE51]MDR6813968.1 putative DNA-binding protein (MmcQ/YjbR family) [Arcicella sp. BE140]MDR6825325.1 putative DNA-binding protein (MmcQ/YjbR family) [Arcicella sp. BE139]